MEGKPKLMRVTTVPVFLFKSLRGQLAFMSRHFHVIGVCSRERYFDELAQESGVPLVAVTIERKISIRSDIKSVISLYKLFRKEKPDIVHTETPKAGLVGMLAAWLARVPVRIHTVAGLPIVEAEGLKYTILKIAEKTQSFCATKVFPNSFSLMEYMADRKLCPREKMQVIGNGASNGIDTDFFDPEQISQVSQKEIRDKYKIPEDAFVFCFIGRMVRDKGVQELIEAFDDLSRKYPERMKLLLVGDYEPALDPISKTTQDVIEKNGDILCTGIQQDVRLFLKVSDVFVLPSYREGFPAVVLEAGAMGVPAIVSDINGCNEIITPGYNGLIVPPKDVLQLREAMEKIFTDKQLLEEITSHARPVVVDKYRSSYLWNCLLEEYHKLLKHVC